LAVGILKASGSGGKMASLLRPPRWMYVEVLPENSRVEHGWF